MTSALLSHWQPALRSGSIAAAFAGLVVAACKQSPSIESGAIQVQDTSKAAEAGRALALPQGCKANEPPSNPTELAACLKGLEFEASIEAVGDQQRLMINPPCPGPCRYGPLATIQPEKHSHLYSDAQLKEGRIIARLQLDSAETKDYKKLGLVPHGVTYWWVLKTSDDSVNAGRSVFLTLAGERVQPPKEYPLKYKEHYGGFKQAVARWVWDPTDETAQGTCGQGCCR